ncbi:copper chaperone PCu(A)C [Paraglaciecola hydrolytica]|uniref:Copper chaperone PCu(A)C n=1 Tax=Paraglaciecola hydrolytica TaxID=1799789 RepID=A0A136A2R8_9ALTE|nr:copper chaperone PCu(A)C [Paraglaciecola hydrolytica]KXI29531.1 hypothetical protein AX660_05590 [Paraglaciecola hydrolytica]
MIKWISLFCAFVLLPCHAELVVKDATLRLLPPGVPNSSAYFALENTGDIAEIIISAAVSTDIARSVEIHKHVMDDDGMHMERQNELTIAAGQSIQFVPGGLHLMVFGLKKPLVEGQSVNFNLSTKAGLQVSFDAIVVRP